jgi:hypothetical protein
MAGSEARSPFRRLKKGREKIERAVTLVML